MSDIDPNQIAFLFNMTVAAGFTWLLTFGISAGVNYFLSWFDVIPAQVKQALNVVLVLVLTALVVAIANSLPLEVQQKTILETLVGLFTAAIAYAGSYFGRSKALMHQGAIMQVLLHVPPTRATTGKTPQIYSQWLPRWMR